MRGRDYQDTSDLSILIPSWRGIEEPSLLKNQRQVSFVSVYDLGGDGGTVQISLVPGVRKTDGHELLQLTITAFGKPDGNDTSSILKWLDHGHEAVVSSFAEFTSRDVQDRLWKRTK
jgi:hypothetical protein